MPEIGSEVDSIYKLKKLIEELKAEAREKDLKVGALQRNFESLSALCLKNENEKMALDRINKQLSLENQNYATELLDKL